MNVVNSSNTFGSVDVSCCSVLPFVSLVEFLVVVRSKDRGTSPECPNVFA